MLIRMLKVGGGGKINLNVENGGFNLIMVGLK